MSGDGSRQSILIGSANTTITTIYLHHAVIAHIDHRANRMRSEERTGEEEYQPGSGRVHTMGLWSAKSSQEGVPGAARCYRAAQTKIRQTLSMELKSPSSTNGD